MKKLMVQSVFDEHQCMFINIHLSLLFLSVFPWFFMKVKLTWYLFQPSWVTLELLTGVFSHYLGMDNLMVQSVFDEHQCMFIKFCLFSVVQCVSLIFHESLSYLIIILTIMSDIRIMKWSVFTQFWYVEFNDAICFWWALMYVHQLLSFQCCSVFFLDLSWKF